MRFEVAALLFDIDGTLVDSTPAVERTWRTMAARHGLDAEAILAVSHGRRSEDTVADFWPVERREAAVAEILALELADLDSVVALPGARRLLAGLPRERWAAVTSGSRALMTARLAAGGLPVPDVLVTAGEVAAGKPDPAGYLLAAERPGFPASACLVVEDAPPGLQAGRNAGARVLAVATSHPVEALGDAEAIIADLTQCRIEPAASGLVVTVGG